MEGTFEKHKKERIRTILGDGKVFDDPEMLADYAKDHSFRVRMRPSMVIRPTDAQEIQAVVRWANETGTPLVPASSGAPRFHGGTVPGATGAVVVDLSKMNRILRIDPRNRMALIEPGVTFAQLQPELAQAGLRLSMPLLPKANKSVVASLLEREPTIIPRFQWAMLDPLRCLEIVWGDGNIFTTGEVSRPGALEKEWENKFAQAMPMGPGQADFYKFVSAAQGSMGIVTWASVKCEVLPRVHKLLLVPSKRIEDLQDFTYEVLKYRFGDELFVLNAVNLATLLSQNRDQREALIRKLPL
jgi:FAD/FMN-containing dehydrogenase